MKRILVVGTDSFIGNNFSAWMAGREGYETETADARGDSWKNVDFSRYDTVFQVAGIAHMGKETPEMEPLFYSINRDMTAAVAAAAKAAGVKQYIFMSTKGVYASYNPCIDHNTPTNPPRMYGKSKLAGEEELRKLEDENFHIAYLRPPSVYGRNAPGSFTKLVEKAKTMAIFPMTENQRSMIYVKNLCEFVRLVIDRSLDGVLVPQDREYICTSRIVSTVGELTGRPVHMSLPLGRLMASLCPKIKKIRKVFGSTTYMHDFSVPDSEYCIYDFRGAIEDMLK